MALRNGRARWRVAITTWLVGWLTAVGTGPVRAQQPEAPPQPTPKAEPPKADEKSEPELSPEELAEIEAALGKDASEAADDDAEAKEKPSSPLASTAAALIPDIALILDVALAWFSEEEPLQTGAHDPTENGFNLQQLELSLSKSVDPYFRLDSNIVLSLFGIEVEEAYATTLSLPLNLQVRAGQMLTRFGRINATHPHSHDFVDQPFQFGKVFGGEGNRGLGAEISVLLPLSWYVELVGSTTTASGEATARSFYGAVERDVDSPLDFQNTLAAKQFFELGPNWSLMFGVSAANGPNPYGKDTRSDVYGTDLYLKYRPITRQSHTVVALQAEWLYRKRQVPLELLHDTGGYVYLFWRFAQRWATAGRYEYGSPTFDRAAEVMVDPLDPEQTSSRHRGSVNLTFWPTEFSRLRLQGSGDFPGWRPDPIWAGFLAFEVVIGAHGSHEF